MISKIYYICKILSSLPKSDRLTNKKILLITVRDYPFILHQELLIANILAKHKAEIIILLDDGKLSHWDTYQIHHKVDKLNPSTSLIRKLVKHALLSLYQNRNIRIVYISSLIKGSARTEISNVDINNCDENNAVSSTRRYFELGGFDRTSIKQVSYYNDSVENIKIMKFCARKLHEKYSFDSVITSHGIYSVWGGPYNYFKALGVPTYMYGIHVYRDSHIQFSDTIGQTLVKDSTWKEFKLNVKLSANHIQMVDNFFIKRRNHTAKDTVTYYSWMKHEMKLNIEKQEPTSRNFAIFTNIIWDGDVTQRDTIFNGMFDFLCHTIDYFLKNKKDNLVIRIHPAEATMYQDSPRFDDLINEKYPDIATFSNIYIIRSDQQIDTYSFCKENIDIGLVYDSILTLELIHMGIPVISPSCSRYTCDSFVLVPKTEEELISMLDSFNPKNFFTDPQKMEIFYKYSYWHLFESAYLMPIYYNEDYERLEFSKRSMEKAKSKDFKKFINRLLSI